MRLLIIFNILQRRRPSCRPISQGKRTREHTPPLTRIILLKQGVSRYRVIICHLTKFYVGVYTVDTVDSVDTVYTMVKSGGNRMKIYGYLFKITVGKGSWGYVAYAPGVGGVYEEGATKEEALDNAYEAACAILETRLEQNDPIIEDSDDIKVLTVLPNLEQLISIKGVSDRYIATRRCLVPAGA